MLLLHGVTSPKLIAPDEFLIPPNPSPPLPNPTFPTAHNSHIVSNVSVSVSIRLS